jgi:aspartyl/asparaginyl beta-hydroxylase (cupin superfamily)
MKNVPLSMEKRPKMFDKQNTRLLENVWLFGPEASVESCQWFNFALLLQNQLLTTNVDAMPATRAAIVEAQTSHALAFRVCGFSWLRPGAQIARHRDYNGDEATPWHLPLLVDDRATLDVDGRASLVLRERRFLTFDDSCYHSATNHSTKHDRVILYMVVEKKEDIDQDDDLLS